MLFVGGVPPQITEELLQAHFKKYGRVHKVKIVVDKKTRESKGYAYITVADARVIPNILKSQHVILDRKLDVQLATSKGDKKKWQDDARQKRVFVSNLPPTATAKDLEDAFSQYGAIHNAYIIYDYQKSAFKDYGYVQFLSASDAAVAVESKISILGKEVVCQPYLNKTQQLEVALASKANSNQANYNNDGECPQNEEDYSRNCSDSEDCSEDGPAASKVQPQIPRARKPLRGPQYTTYENSQMWQMPAISNPETPCVVGQPSHHFDESIEPFEPRSFTNQHGTVGVGAVHASSGKPTKVYQHGSVSASSEERARQSTFSLFGSQPAVLKKKNLLKESSVASAERFIAGKDARPATMDQREDNYRFNYDPRKVVFRPATHSYTDVSNHAVEIYSPQTSLCSASGGWGYSNTFSMAEGPMLTISAAMRRALLSQDTLGCLHLIHQIAFGGAARAEDLLNSSTSKDNSTLGASSRVFARQTSGEKSQQSRPKSGASRDSSSASKGASSCGNQSPLFTELNDPADV